MLYSFIIPVYNRPEEIQALLECILKQTYQNFEVLIIESGSEIKSDKVVQSFASQLDIHYYYKGNDGQGFSRNYGMARSKGDFFVILDSDVLLDPDYLQNLDEGIKADNLDAFGGPDKLHPAANDMQKAVNYSMTSFLTTGGIRGSKKNMGKFYPRSFNMGISRKVYEATGGYRYYGFGFQNRFGRKGACVSRTKKNDSGLLQTNALVWKGSSKYQSIFSRYTKTNSFCTSGVCLISALDYYFWNVQSKNSIAFIYAFCGIFCSCFCRFANYL
jgi:glycosyltransferase involved in cell wall biosynthesis